MKRNNGYYWIKPKERDWIISLSYQGLFKHLGKDNTIEWFGDKELDKINEVMLMPPDQEGTFIFEEKK
jgi:hypothetical protein